MSTDVVIDAALAGSSSLYWVSRTVTSGYFAWISSMKPLARASVVEMPACTFITKTDPLPPIWSPSRSAASLPPPALSEEMTETAIDWSSSPVSTMTSLMPASVSCLSGANIALVSFGAMRTASGCWAVTEFTTGVCTSAPHLSPPTTVTVAPSLAASDCTPQAMVA